MRERKCNTLVLLGVRHINTYVTIFVYAPSALFLMHTSILCLASEDRRIVMAHQQMPSSQKALMLELKSLQEEPVEGFRITLVEESDLYNWEVAIFGPPNTLYEGGYFKVRDS